MIISVSDNRIMPNVHIFFFNKWINVSTYIYSGVAKGGLGGHRPPCSEAVPPRCPPTENFESA